MPESRPLRALVCDRNPIVLQATSHVLEDQGYDIVAVADNAIEAIRLNDLARPSLVVISNDQVGLSGFDALGDLRSGGDEPEILLLAGDGSLREHAKEAGAFDVAIEGDADMLERMIGEVTTLLATGERRFTGDRRHNGDRREEQDWSKVTTERRSGDDRRHGLRRELDVTSKAKDVLSRPRSSS